MSAHPIPRRVGGFTALEVITALFLVTAMAALAILVPMRARPRAELNGFTLEVMGLLHQARQQALLDGNNVIVVLLPAFANPRGGRGRIVVYENPDGAFFAPARRWAQGTFLTDTDVTRAGAGDSVIETLDFPRTVEVALSWNAPLPAPYASIPWAPSASFSAIRFDSRGRATFYDLGAVNPQGASGGSFTLATTRVSTRNDLLNRLTPDIRTIAVWGSTGTAQLFTRAQEM